VAGHDTLAVAIFLRGERFSSCPRGDSVVPLLAVSQTSPNQPCTIVT
jgi:hypothetical protein